MSRAISAPLKNMYDWGDRSLPVTARLRSLFFITSGGPQAHGHSLPVTARLRRAASFVLSAFGFGQHELGVALGLILPRTGYRGRLLAELRRFRDLPLIQRHLPDLIINHAKFE